MGGAALVTSLSAGCLSSLPPLGNNQRYGRLGVPAGDDPAYRRWLPAPTSIEGSVEPYAFVALQPISPQPGAPEEFIARRAYSKADVDYFGIGFENYDRLLDSSLGAVIEASFDRQSVTRALVDSGYEPRGEYRGYTVLSRSDVPRRVAVGDSAIVWTSVNRHESPHLEALVDAGEGDRPRYHEESPRFDRLTTAAGGNAHLIVNTDIHDPTGRPAMLADAFRFDDDTAYQVLYYHYDDGSAPTESALKTGIQEHSYRFTAEADTFDVQIDGSLATAETRVPLGSGGDIPPEYDLPQVTWGGVHDADAATLTFRHEAGESVRASQLYYDVDSPDDAGEVEKLPLWTDADTVSPGSETVVDLTEHPNAEGLTLVYSIGGSHFWTLFDFDLEGER